MKKWIRNFKFTRNETIVLTFVAAMVLLGTAYRVFIKKNSSEKKVFSYSDKTKLFREVKDLRSNEQENYLEFNNNDIDSQHKVLDFNNNKIKNPSNSAIPQKDRIDLNNATLEELTGLPGVGEKIAREIIAYRKNVQNFQTVEELLSIKGIGYVKFHEIKEYVFITSEN